ncbi:hypothetical protein pEaSNUABM19_00359 [Erwinia phage pEa_SNUABM_19]|nr:hypothetical protein pEaSNUABM19_00359 [Erwinia phage pEa_SNUABM_19]
MASVMALAVLSTSAVADDDFKTVPLCKVQVCNKIERFSMSLWSHMKDSMGETCMDIVIPKTEAVVGNALSDESRWYQGSSINPTKRSVTRVSQVYKCQE